MAIRVVLICLAVVTVAFFGFLLGTDGLGATTIGFGLSTLVFLGLSKAPGEVRRSVAS